jgi:hypothetical protein
MIKGGITKDTHSIILTLPTKAGGSFNKVYDSSVDDAIRKFTTINKAIEIIDDDNFYITQIRLLMKKAHVEFINGNNNFQKNYDLWLIDGYVRMLLESMDMKLIVQLLGLDSIIYNVEHVARSEGNDGIIDFDIPNLKIVEHHKKIYIPESHDNIKNYITSIKHNMNILCMFINDNKQNIEIIYNKIIKDTAKYLI